MPIVIFILFVALSLFIWKKNLWSISLYLVLVYTISLFGSIYFVSTGDTDYNNLSISSKVLSSAIFVVALYFLFQPYMIKAPSILCTNNRDFLNRFTKVGYIIIIFLIIGILLLLPKIQEVFKIGLGDVRYAMYKEESLTSNYTATEHIGHSILRWLGGLSYIAMIMFFYALCFIRGKSILKILLLIATLGNTYLGMLNGGRTHLIYWILYFGFCIFLFWPYMKKKSKLYLSVISSIILVLLGVYFMYMTFQRVEKNNTVVDDFLLSYLGQSYPNFCVYFTDIDFHPYSLQRILPISSSFIYGSLDLREYREIIYSHTGKEIGVFYTLLGDLFVDVGVLGMFIYVWGYNRLTNKLLKSNSFNLSKLMILGILFQIPLHGVFYYSFYKIEVMIDALIIIIISRYLKK